MNILTRFSEQLLTFEFARIISLISSRLSSRKSVRMTSISYSLCTLYFRKVTVTPEHIEGPLIISQ